MTNDYEPLPEIVESRAGRLGIWLAENSAVFRRLAGERPQLFTFLVPAFVFLLYWLTAWFTPWIYIAVMLAGLWLNEGVNGYINIIKMMLDQNQPLTSNPFAGVLFMLTNWAAFFSCLFMLGTVHDSECQIVTGMWNYFYFSVVTMTTLGYGNLVPMGLWAEFVAVLASLIGFMGFAVLAGVVAGLVIERSKN